ncbi:MAG TPA: PQQ-binding-like beta-propeller repeat protein [Candidatus Koribacter sp.]|jgi:outer membrane protein assembly factor BamB
MSTSLIRPALFRVLAAAVALGSLLCNANAASDTTMFRGGPTHPGVYASDAPTNSATVKWRFKTDSRVIGSAAIADGAVYFGSFDGSFYAVDENSGGLRWKFDTDGAITSSAAIEKGIAYFGSFDGNFYAVDLATGKLKWKFATKGERRFAAKHIHGIDPPAETMPDFWDFYLSSPVVSEGAVYFGSGDGNVYKLNADSGEKMWEFPTGDVVHSSPSLANGVIYIGSFDRFFYAIDASTGKEKWRYKTGEDPVIHNQEGITSSPAVADGTVFFGCRNATVYALDAATGNLKWSQKGDRGWVSVSPAVHDGKVYVATGSDKALKVLDATSGKVLYAKPVRAGTFSSVAVVGNHILLATFDGKLHSIDPQADTETVIYPVGEQPPPAPINMETNFYDDHVAAMVERLKQGIFLSSPVVADHLIFIGTTDGYMLAIGN